MFYLEPIVWMGALQDYRVKRDWFRFGVNMLNAAPLGILFSAAAFEGPKMVQHIWDIQNDIQGSKKTPVDSNRKAGNGSSKHIPTEQSLPDHPSQSEQSKTDVQQILAPLNSEAEPLQEPNSQPDSDKEMDQLNMVGDKPDHGSVEESADTTDNNSVEGSADTSAVSPVEQSVVSSDEHAAQQSSDTPDNNSVDTFFNTFDVGPVEESTDTSKDNTIEKPADTPEGNSNDKTGDNADEPSNDQQGGVPVDDKDHASSGLSSTQEEVLAALRENPSMTKPQLVAKLSRSKTTIDNSIRALRESGRLVRIGSNKTGHWQVLDPQ